MITEQQMPASTLRREPRKSFGVGQPCEDDSVDLDDYKRKLIAAVEEGLASLDRGEFITLEELEKEYYSWTFE